MIEPAPEQSLSDIENGPFHESPSWSPVGAVPYLVPAEWVDDNGDGGYVLKENYRTPDGYWLYVTGQIEQTVGAWPDYATSPPPEQVESVESLSLDGWVDLGGWNEENEPWPSGKQPFIPESWVDTAGGVFKPGYLTPGQYYLWHLNDVPSVEIDPPAATATATTYTLPVAEGAAWYVDGVATEPGTYTVDTSAGGTVQIVVTVEPAAGYTFSADPEPQTFTFKPEPDPEPDPDPTGAETAVKHLARLLGRPTDQPTLDGLLPYYEQVRLFVMEYTRGRGFSDDGKPAPPLMAVICAGAGRLAANPEQMTYYQMDNVTVRPAVFHGYTLAEQGVLHRYRRRSA